MKTIITATMLLISTLGIGQDFYRVTAKSKADYMGNSKWVDLKVEATVTDYSKIIYNVYYNDGY